MADAEAILDAIFDISLAMHECRNSATFLAGEKIQLGVLFDKMTTRATLIRLNRDAVDVATETARILARDQLVSAGELLRIATRRSKRQEAIGEAFEALALLDALLPQEAQPFLM